MVMSDRMLAGLLLARAFLPTLGELVVAHIEVGAALWALLNRSSLRRREGTGIATFLADYFDGRPRRVSGARCP
jgi:hypothetical protein